MGKEMMILVINAGSSSLKFSLYLMPSEKNLCSGIADRVGMPEAHIHYRLNGEQPSGEMIKTTLNDHSHALATLVKILKDPAHKLFANDDEPDFIVHRVVHGGSQFKAATRITKDVEDHIQSLSSIAPLHNPINLTCIKVAETLFPASKQIAVFDTAFHQTLPPHAYEYAIPGDLNKDKNIRVYGFHGISHKYISEKALVHLKKEDAKLISMHLGNGCSMAAIRGKKSMDTSMGFSPLDGLVMGSRSGNIDPSVILHWIKYEGYSADQIEQQLNHSAGLKGITGFSDLRDIEKNPGKKENALALDLYAYRIKKFIGAYAAVLNGLDAILFTGGVGENDSAMRARICQDLDFLGIVIDGNKNTKATQGLNEIQAGHSPVRILVIPTNEELEMARQCFELVN